MLDSLVLALSVAVASSHVEAHDVTTPQAINFSASTPIIRQADAATMVVLLNSMRNAAGLTPLIEDPALSAVALEHAQEMLRNNYFGHQGPQGLTIKQRFLAHHIHATIDGENLAWCNNLHEASVDLWQSPVHQTNERDPRFHHVGVAAIQAGSLGTLYVQIFTQ